MLPDSAINLLKSTRFLHLATSHNDFPHVSLMNYTFYQDGDTDYVILTTPKDTTKYNNIKNNNKVSMLVHDWISAKNEDNVSRDDSEPKRRNSLFELITNLNKTEISSVSVMINGEAKIIPPNDPKYKLYKSLHLNNETIEPQQLDNYVKDDINELVLISITNCKITDTNNNVQEY